MTAPKALMVLLLLAGTATAYGNASMTGPYLKMVGGDYIHAIQDANTAAWGSWFYFVIPMAIYGGLYLQYRNMNVPTIWLTTVLAAYGSFVYGLDASVSPIPQHIFYMLIVAWVMSVLVKLLSPSYSN